IDATACDAAKTPRLRHPAPQISPGQLVHRLFMGEEGKKKEKKAFALQMLRIWQPSRARSAGEERARQDVDWFTGSKWASELPYTLRMPIFMGERRKDEEK